MPEPGDDDARLPAPHDASAPAPAFPEPLAAAVVAFASGAVLVLEILGVRLLAPYVGLTLETTTSIIGVVLAGIAAGAAVGGRLADELSAPRGRRLSGLLLLSGGALALTTVPIVRLLGPGASGASSGSALLITLLALFPPAAVLSAVTPAVVKVQLQDIARSGTVVGRLSAWSTGGALVGTFSAGFIFVPTMPTSTAIIAVGALLVVLGAAIVVRGSDGPDQRGAAAGGVAAALALGLLTAAIGSGCDAETRYHCATIEVDTKREGGRVLRLDDLRHSYVDLDDPTHLEFDYSVWLRDLLDGALPPPRRLDAVFVGGGGFTFPRYLAVERPGTRSTVLEVDPELIELDRDRLGLRTGPDLRAIAGDARLTMRELATASADVVVGDAFGGRSIPWHLATEEFLNDVRRVLRPGGVYLVNIIDYPPLELARAEARTLLAVFDDVRLVSIPPAGRPREPGGGNLVLIGTDGLTLPPEASTTARKARTFDRAALERFAGDADVLTDDDAPADQLLNPAA